MLPHSTCGVDAVILQRFADFGNVIGVARFQGADNHDTGNVGGTDVAVVGDFLNVGAGGGEDRGQVGQGAGPIEEAGEYAAKTAVGGEATIDDAGDRGHINVAAAEGQDHVLASQAHGFVHRRREGYGAGAFDDGLFQFQKAKDRQGDWPSSTSITRSTNF